MNKIFTFKNFSIKFFPILMLALIGLLTVLGCEPQSTGTDAENSDSSDPTLPGLAVINEISTTSDITQNSITISWTVPTVTGTATDSTVATITGYKVYYNEGVTVTVDDGTLLNATTEEGLLTATTIEISNLTPGTHYAFIVVTINSLGKTSTSVVANATTVHAATDPGQITFTSVATSDSITLSWVAPDPGTNGNGTPSIITGYRAYFGLGQSVTPNEDTLLNKDQNGGLQTATNVTVTGLEVSSEYLFIVITYNTAGLTSYSISQQYTVAVYTKLGANGQPLATQDGTWDNNGTESEGTKWSCVLNKRSTNEYWEVKTDDAGEQNKDNKYIWGGETATAGDWYALVNEANDTANNGANGLCGFTNWRVPTIAELKTIVESTPINSLYINTNYFPNAQGSKYWSATPRGNSSGSVIDFRSGSRNDGLDRTSNAYVRLVRTEG